MMDDLMEGLGRKERKGKEAGERLKDFCWLGVRFKLDEIHFYGNYKKNFDEKWTL
jgi:hypothetical protein